MKRELKKEIRILGIDDAPHTRSQENVLVIAPFFRGGHFMDGLLSTTIKRDGDDATVKIIEMVNKSKFRSQLQAILTDGIAFGGFNVFNIEAVAKHTGIPTITIIRKYPDFTSIKATLKKLGMEKKYQLMEIAGKPERVDLKRGHVWFQHKGCTLEQAKKFIILTATHSYIPEPIRIAHIIGQGIVEGESKGRA